MADGYLVLRSPGGRASTLERLSAASGLNPCVVKRANVENPFWAQRYNGGQPMHAGSVINKGIFLRLRKMGPTATAPAPTTATAPPPTAAPTAWAPTPAPRAHQKAAATPPPTTTSATWAPSPAPRPHRLPAPPPRIAPAWFRVGATVEADDSSRGIATGDTGPTGFATAPEWFPATIIRVLPGTDTARCRARVHFRDYGKGTKWDTDLDAAKIRPASW